MSIIASLTTEQLAARLRRVLKQQRAAADLEPWEADSLREMINVAWHLERRLEVWEDYQSIKREGRA